MKHAHQSLRRWVVQAITVACLAGMSAASTARASVTTFTLENVWLLPDISHPGAAAQPMTGTIEWTYEDGDFENGVGEFVELSLPWWSDSLPPLDWTIEVSMLEITMPGKFHDHGVDVTLRFLEPLSPDHASPIDAVESQFEIQVGITWKGHVSSGSVVPVSVACDPADLDGDADVGVADLLILLDGWGGAGGDVTGDGTTDVSDMLALLASWGPCL